MSHGERWQIMISRLGLLLASFTFCSVSLPAADLPTNVVAKLVAVPPCVPLANAARTNQIPIDGIDPYTSNTNLQPGDSICVLVTLFEKKAQRTQWLLYVKVVEPTAKELATKPEPPMKVTTARSNKLEFASSQAWMSLRTLGPFADATPKRKPPKAEDHIERFAANKGFLSLGLDRSAAVMMRLADMATNNASAKPGKAKSKDDLLNLSDEDERTLYGMGPAMGSFFSIVEHTSGLEKILFQLVTLPSMWSMVWHVGVQADLQMPAGPIVARNGETWGLHTTNSAYYVPMSLKLNKQPALNVTLVAAPAQPPLLTCAGIVGILCEKPDDKEQYMTLRIISAKRNQPKPGE
jgi:hypothetical protein